MTFQSTMFDMGSVMNRLRSIAEDNQGGQEIDNASFTRTMARLSAIKDAVGEDNYNAMRSGVRSLYMNRRPNLQQMTALMDLLETILSYVAEDNALFQRLKTDLAQSASQAASREPAAPGIGAPSTAAPSASPEPEMRGLKT